MREIASEIIAARYQTLQWFMLYN